MLSNTAGAFLNNPGDGGGIWSGAGLTSVNNTFSGNSASTSGGGLYNITGTTYLTHTTIASNTSGSGIDAAGGAVEVLATLLAYNTGNDCADAGTITDNGDSMSSDASCSGFTFVSTNPLLQPLALNGGQTLNHALPLGSPALDKVPAAQCDVLNDQRGVTRPQSSGCDVGAFELALTRVYAPTTRKP